MSLLAGVRRLARTPLVGRLTGVTPAIRVSFALRGLIVRERARFAANELRRRDVTAVYHVRDSGEAVAIRHHSADVMALDEIFSQHEYEPPPAAEEVLAGLGPPLRVLDVGANIGLFAAFVRGRFGDASVLALEPDPDNAAVHELAIEASGHAASWRLVQAFAGVSAGSARFVAGGHTTAHRAGPGEHGIDVPAVDVFELLADRDLVKIDIEGAEWDVLSDPRFAALAPVLVLEYHPEGSPGPDPAAEARGALERAGYAVEQGPTNTEHGTGVLWAVQRRA